MTDDAPSPAALLLNEDARRGPQNPALSTPALAAGGVRRTTTVDAALPTLAGHPIEVVLTGRDLVLGSDGSRTEEHQSLVLTLQDASRRIETMIVRPARPVDGLLDARVGPGFRKQLATVLDPTGPATLLYSLLDQLPGATFLVGYTRMADDPPTVDSPQVRERFASRVGLCAGYTATGTIGTWVNALGHSPVPRGPAAPDLRGPDPDSWHELPPLAPLSFRRARRIDVGPVLDDGTIEIDSMFRDLNVDRDGSQTVLHEYALLLRIALAPGGARGVVVAAEARPCVLPWRECPAAAGSAARIVGVPVGDLRRWVSTHLSGPTTCTHLNEALRVLADIEHLVDAMVRAGP